MERVIYRTTYKNLYLFKKTLQETGQLVMAANVPVKLCERNAGSQESSVAKTAVHLEELEMVEEDNISDQKLKWKLEQPPVEVLQGLEDVPENYTGTPIRTTQTK